MEGVIFFFFLDMKPQGMDVWAGGEEGSESIEETARCSWAPFHGLRSSGEFLTLGVTVVQYGHLVANDCPCMRGVFNIRRRFIRSS